MPETDLRSRVRVAFLGDAFGDGVNGRDYVKRLADAVFDLSSTMMAL
jgi:hypothetical protein